MVRPITESQQQGRASAQRADIYMRQEFLNLNSQTQQKVVDLLKKMDTITRKQDKWEAQKHFFTQVYKHNQPLKGLIVDQKGIDWQEVCDQIKYFCFSDHDMEGLSLVPRRVEQSITTFSSLIELPHQREDF
ncbi:MAG: hypothetical protein WAV41_02645 [Microgenomates group bacterium]